jgi:hypothetical protein
MQNLCYRGTLLAVPAPEHLAIANDVYNSAVAQAEMEASFEEVSIFVTESAR